MHTKQDKQQAGGPCEGTAAVAAQGCAGAGNEGAGAAAAAAQESAWGDRRSGDETCVGEGTNGGGTGGSACGGEGAGGSACGGEGAGGTNGGEGAGGENGSGLVGGEERGGDIAGNGACDSGAGGDNAGNPQCTDAAASAGLAQASASASASAPVQAQTQGRVFGYARVSARDQNLDRQLDALARFPVEESRVFADKASGKDFERPAYRRLMRRLAPGDVLVVKSIDRLGRDYDDILEQWRLLTKRKRVHIVVLDMPLLDTRERSGTAGGIGGVTGAFLADVVLQLLSYVAQVERESIRQRQAEGIAAAQARGVRFGRPPKPRPQNYAQVVEMYRGGASPEHKPPRPRESRLGRFPAGWSRTRPAGRSLPSPPAREADKPFRGRPQLVRGRAGRTKTPPKKNGCRGAVRLKP